jgi:superkiller protein 3
MSSVVKSKLKASREAIQAKDWNTAYAAAQEVLEHDAGNYNALVFKALAASNLNKDDESETLYERAITVQPTQQLAWQGLDRFLTERKSWPKLVDLLQRQADRALEDDDAIRCAECVQRIVTIQKQEGFRSDHIKALSMYLPDSAYHALLSSLPVPDQTTPTATTTFDAQMAIHTDSLKILLEVISLVEASERDAVDKEVDKRKNRLDSMAKPRDVLRNEIGLEIWQSSNLPSLYEQVLSHITASDEERREAEHKMLLYKLTMLKALPDPRFKHTGPGSASANPIATEEDDAEAQQRKEAMLLEVKELAEGIVAIDVADELAWLTVLEWQDCFYFTELNKQRLRAFVHHFPRSGVSRSIEALLHKMKDEQFAAEQAKLKIEEKDTEYCPQHDPLNLALDGLELAPESLLAQRVVAALYLIDRDWVSCSDLVGSALALLRRMETQLGLQLEQIRASLEALISVALTYLHAPQHHIRATRMSDAVLLRDPKNVEALLSHASIASASGKWQLARSTLEIVQGQDQAKSDDVSYRTQRLLSIYPHPGRDARLDIAWCDVHLGQLEQAEEEFRTVIDELESEKDTTHDQAKAWWRLGQCLWRMDGDRRTGRGNAFTCFITSLKRDPAFAPAFTSLGIFYADVAEPSDLTRASKCFQKAFELDASEFEAARRLAEMYADEEDWDLVDLVARRTIEAEGGSWILNVGRSATQTDQQRRQRRQTTLNAWAWHAIGSSELLKGNFERAIVALQVALRSFSDEQHIWMRLGDAYVASGRHSAAIKTYERAQALQEPQARWQAAYCIAQTQYELGMYEDAIAVLENIIKEKPDIIDVRLTCAHVRLSMANKQTKQGYVVRSFDELCRCVKDVGQVLRHRPNSQSAWKIFSDALLALSRSSGIDQRQDLVDPLIAFVSGQCKPEEIDDALPSVTSVSSGSIAEYSGARLLLPVLAAYVCKARVSKLTKDDETAGSSWMDLSIALSEVAKGLRQSGKSDADRVGLTQGEAISCAKEALKLEPGNGTYWNILGSLTASFGVSLAQHCYVRAIECDGKDVSAWSNLGVLYLSNEDYNLANECFVRAQTIDPDMVNAWVGQALVASHRGETRQAASLFRHAFSIDQEASSEAAYGAASATLAQLHCPRNESHTKLNVGHLRTCAAALAVFLSRNPDDVAGLHLAALFDEHICALDTDADSSSDGTDASSGRWHAAARQIERAAEQLEAEYEEKETRITSQRFAVCMANLGRIYVSSGRFDQGLEKFELCLGLLDDDGGDVQGESLAESDLRRAKMGAHCGMALAYVGLAQYDEAVDALTLALDDQVDDEKAKEIQTTLLAQILVKSGDEAEARGVLSEYVDSQSSSLAARTLLAALAWLDGDRSQVDVVTDEIVARISDLQSSDAQKAVELLAYFDLHDGRIESGLHRLHEIGRFSAHARVQLCEAAVRHAVLRGPGDAETCAMASATCENVHRSLLSARDADVSERLLVRATQLRTVARALQLKSNEHDDSKSSTTVLSPWLSATHAVLRSPNEEQNWRLLQATCNM